MLQITDITTQPIRLSKSQRWGDVKPRVYLSFKGETIVDDLMNRRRRPYEVIKPLLAELLACETKAQDVKLSWSQKAGCSCGCSPGFIVSGYVPSLERSDAWIQIEDK
jgi:hypothetical protein